LKSLRRNENIKAPWIMQGAFFGLVVVSKNMEQSKISFYTKYTLMMHFDINGMRWVDFVRVLVYR